VEVTRAVCYDAREENGRVAALVARRFAELASERKCCSSAGKNDGR